MDRDVCGECWAPTQLCTCFDIFTHKKWCNHCKDHVDLRTHYETCEFAALKKEVETLREENHKMRQVIMASYAPRAWEDEK